MASGTEMVLDARKADLHTTAERLIYVELTPEVGRPGRFAHVAVGLCVGRAIR